MPQCEIDGVEPLNNVFGECLVKYIDVLGRKGCCRTAVEFCKLLLGLNPKVDPHGVLLRIDYYSIRAKQYQFLLDFVNNYSNEVFGKNDENISCVKLLPNLLMSSALALKNVKEEESKNHNEDLEEAVSKIKTAVDSGSVRNLFDYKNADVLVIITLLLYPQMIADVLNKIAKK